MALRVAAECKHCGHEATRLAASAVHPQRRVRNLTFGGCASVEYDHHGTAPCPAPLHSEPVHSKRVALSRLVVAGKPLPDLTGGDSAGTVLRTSEDLPAVLKPTWTD